MKKAAFLFVFILACNFIVAQDYKYFIKFEDIPGESTDRAHKDWCDMESLEQQVGSQVNSGPRPEPPVPVGKTVSVIKKIDKSSPKVMEVLTQGKRIRNVEIDVSRQVGDGRNKVFYRYELNNVTLTKYNVLAIDSEYPMEEITLEFEEQRVIYTLYGIDGSPGGTIETVYR